MSRNVLAMALSKTLPGASGLLGLNGNTLDTPTVTGSRCTYRGFAVEETSGAAAAKVRLREGGATGKIIEVIPLAAGEGASAFFESGLIVFGDIYVEIVSGAVEGSIRYS